MLEVPAHRTTPTAATTHDTHEAIDTHPKRSPASPLSQHRQHSWPSPLSFITAFCEYQLAHNATCPPYQQRFTPSRPHLHLHLQLTSNCKFCFPASSCCTVIHITSAILLLVGPTRSPYFRMICSQSDWSPIAILVLWRFLVLRLKGTQSMTMTSYILCLESTYLHNLVAPRGSSCLMISYPIYPTRRSASLFFVTPPL